MKFEIGGHKKSESTQQELAPKSKNDGHTPIDGLERWQGVAQHMTAESIGRCSPSILGLKIPK